ncbi:hypothetical protein [Facilibium subflavum]|uniref:hypothetical protein n=1 Tax=Facilibium subflavum TaxID=2219058 RepID=UPI000E655F85|nr:hypothetical protein [Facilibium subflavum]
MIKEITMNKSIVIATMAVLSCMGTKSFAVSTDFRACNMTDLSIIRGAHAEDGPDYAAVIYPGKCQEIENSGANETIAFYDPNQRNKLLCQFTVTGIATHAFWSSSLATGYVGPHASGYTCGFTENNILVPSGSDASKYACSNYSDYSDDNCDIGLFKS